MFRTSEFCDFRRGTKHKKVDEEAFSSLLVPWASY